ncbi:MAG: immunoglobulin domain-containing protein, partial [Candidatus Kapaibacterium sp.]
MRTSSGASCYVSRYSLGQVTLSTPKVGELVCAGSAVKISWQTIDLADSVQYFVEYRKVGSGGWSTIAKSLRTKSVSWTVPRSIVPGTYEVRVMSQFGHASKTSDPITIDINPAVTLRSSPPRDCEGASVRMVAIPANVVATFQWRRNGVNLSGATDSVYVITSLDADNVGLYDCVVGGRCAQNDTSQPIEVGVTLRPVIRSQPSSVTVNASERLRLGVSVDGAGMSFQWYRDSLKLKNATNAEFVIDKATVADSGRYWCSVANACGSTISNIAVVSVRLGTSVIDRETESTFLRLLSPQPVHDELVLECRAQAGVLSLGLNDLMGRQLLKSPLAVNLLGEVQTVVVPVSHIEPGLKIIVLQSRDEVLSLPVLLVR